MIISIVIMIFGVQNSIQKDHGKEHKKDKDNNNIQIQNKRQVESLRILESLLTTRIITKPPRKI
jgi:hypothetical protein